MKYFELEPEVAGGFGPASELDRARPPKVSKFNYEFDVWLGDPLLEAVSNFIVTDQLKDGLLGVSATGVSFGQVDVTKSGEFEDRYPGRRLPTFSWLQIVGQAGKDDFGLSETGNLVVSERILDLLQEFGVKHCTVTQYSSKVEH